MTPLRILIPFLCISLAGALLSYRQKKLMDVRNDKVEAMLKLQKYKRIAQNMQKMGLQPSRDTRRDIQKYKMKVQMLAAEEKIFTGQGNGKTAKSALPTLQLQPKDFVPNPLPMADTMTNIVTGIDVVPKRTVFSNILSQMFGSASTKKSTKSKKLPRKSKKSSKKAKKLKKAVDAAVAKSGKKGLASGKPKAQKPKQVSPKPKASKPKKKAAIKQKPRKPIPTATFFQTQECLELDARPIKCSHTNPCKSNLLSCVKIFGKRRCCPTSKMARKMYNDQLEQQRDIAEYQAKLAMQQQFGMV